MRGKLRGGGAGRRHAELLHPFLDGRLGENGSGVGVKLADDAGGVLAGTKNANHEDTLKPGIPDSAMVGRSGAVRNLSAVVTASPRTCPPRMRGNAVPMVLNMTSTRPGMRSLMAGPPPR